jgi:hypothetical protein
MTEISDLCLISEIEPIQKSANGSVTQRSQLNALIEAPLLKACEYLYDLNIETTVSSANKKDVRGGRASIGINYFHLSETNRAIAKQLGAEYIENTSGLFLYISLDENSTVGEVECASMELAKQFKPQKMTWATTHTHDELCKAYGIHDSNRFTPSDFEEQEGLYYDSQNKLYYMSKEHFEKVQSSKDLEG